MAIKGCRSANKSAGVDATVGKGGDAGDGAGAG
jgi:hypothetical protein